LTRTTLADINLSWFNINNIPITFF